MAFAKLMAPAIRSLILGIDSKPMMAAFTVTNVCVLSGTGKKYTTNSGGTWRDCAFNGLRSFSASNGRAHVFIAESTTVGYVLLPGGNGF